MRTRYLLALTSAIIVFFSSFKSSTTEGNSGDPIVFKFNVPKGTKFSYDVTMGMDINQNIAGQQMAVKMKIGMGYTFEVVADSAGWKTLNATISRVLMDINTNGTSIKYDSDSPDNDTTSPTGKFAVVMGALKGGQFGYTINENGEIGRVTGIKELSDKIANSVNSSYRAMAQQSLGQTFNEQSFKQSMQQSFAMYPGKPVNIGDSWSSTLTMNNNGMPMKLVNTYTLAAVEGAKLKVDVNSKITGAGSASSQPGIQIDMNGDMKGIYYFDQPTGMPLNGDADMTINMKMKAQGQEIPMKMGMKIIVTGKKE